MAISVAHCRCLPGEQEHTRVCEAVCAHATSSASELARAASPAAIWDAPCSVHEPAARRPRYSVAVLVTTNRDRLWMVRLQRERWLHAFAHLIVSDWSDPNSTIVGMRWGVSHAHKALAGSLCLGNALRGRFDWMLVGDDDTTPDLAALQRLVGGELRWAAPSTPWFMSFVPQPWVRRTKNPRSYRGCVGNVTAPCAWPPCREPADLTQPCLGEPITGVCL